MQLVYQNKPIHVPKTVRMAEKPSEEPLDSFSLKKKKKKSISQITIQRGLIAVTKNWPALAEQIYFASCIGY